MEWPLALAQRLNGTLVQLDSSCNTTLTVDIKILVFIHSSVHMCTLYTLKVFKDVRSFPKLPCNSHRLPFPSFHLRHKYSKSQLPYTNVTLYLSIICYYFLYPWPLDEWMNGRIRWIACNIAFAISKLIYTYLQIHYPQPITHTIHT